MSEKRFKSTIDEDTMSIMPYLVSDKEEECFYNLEGCVDLLNEQQATILFLQDEIDELKKDIDIYEYEEKKHSKTARKLYEENEQLKETIEKLRWDLDTTREDLNYFANLKLTAMKGYEPMEDDGDGV